MSVDYTTVGRYPGITGHVIDEHWLGYGQFEASRWVRCAWADRYALIDELGAGAGEVWPYGTAIPARLVAARSFGYGRATAGVDTLPIYESAVIQLFYSTDAPFVATPYVLSEEITPWHETTVLDPLPWSWVWQTSDAIVEQEIPHQFPGLKYTLTLYQITAPPAGMFTNINCCNAGIWNTYTLGISFAAQTLLHADPYVERVVRVGTQVRYRIVYNWFFRPAGWNKKWNAKEFQWETIVRGWGDIPVVFHPPISFATILP